MVIRPDCADLPYFLRAYYAFKMGLPYGFSKCSRGGGGRGPTCVGWSNILNANHTPATAAGGQNPDAVASITQSPEAAPKRLGLAASFGAYLRPLADGVHSGSARTALNDNNTDYYPVPLTQETLRPGVVYADPYGHVLMLVKRIPQTKDAGRRHPRGRRPAGRHGVAQALLARQFLVRAGSRRSAARASSASARSCARAMAACGGSPTRRSPRIRNTPISRSSNRSLASKTSTTAWTT